MAGQTDKKPEVDEEGTAAAGAELRLAKAAVELVLKLAPLLVPLMLAAAGLMVFTYLQSIGAASMFVPAVTSVSGLAAIGVGSIILVVLVMGLLLMPPMFLLGVEVYGKGRQLPKRVPIILISMLGVWAIVWIYCLATESFKALNVGWLMCALLAVALAGYAAPGILRALRHEGDDCAEMRRIFFEEWATALDDVPTQKESSDVPTSVGDSAEAADAEPPGGLKKIVAPCAVVMMLWLPIVLMVFPIYVISTVFGRTWVGASSDVVAIAAILGTGLLTSFPALAYTWLRSRTASLADAGRFAFLTALVCISVWTFLMVNSPVRDRVFQVLHIFEPQNQEFMVTSDLAKEQLEELKFMLDVRDKKNYATGTKNFAFGDVVLLCKPGVDLKNNPTEVGECAQLLRSDLRFIRNKAAG